MQRTAALLLLSTVAAACSGSPEGEISRTTAIDLLQAGEVTQIGVTHSGWTSLTLADGSYVGNRAKVIGYPDELLQACGSCENVIQWIE